MCTARSLRILRYKTYQRFQSGGYWIRSGGVLNLQDSKMQDWQMMDEVKGVDNGGLENDGRSCKGGN